LWDFDVRYMLEKKNNLVNRLLQRLLDKEWPNKLEEDIKEFIDCELSTLKYITSLVEIEIGLLLKDLYLKEF